MAGGTTWAMAGGIACPLLVVLAIGVGLTYNRLERLRGQADTTWEQITGQLRRRYDLAPRLVETVRPWLGHERVLIAAVASARSAAMAADDLDTRARAEDELTAALRHLVAASEAYAEVRSLPSFAPLTVELMMIEDKIAYAGQSFNTAAQSYNSAVRSLPSNLVAAAWGFRPRALFQA